MNDNHEPLRDLEEWDEFVKSVRSPDAQRRKKSGDSFRDYRSHANDAVRDFYRLNHQNQTLEFARQKKAEYAPLERCKMSVWDAIDRLDEVIDDSDPDTELTQLEHSMQTAEAIRADGHPRWLVLTGLIHDLGKVLCLFGEPQWAVVGDTFPLGCRFDDSIVFHEYFAENPDTQVEQFQSDMGIYPIHCGLDQVTMSWGHDEYLYQVVKPWLPDEALAIIRFHSFYPAHTDGAYGHLMTGHDKSMMKFVRTFNPYDLYSKDHSPPNIRELRPFYRDLVNEFLPKELCW